MRLRTAGIVMVVTMALAGTASGPAGAAPSDIRIVASPAGATAGYLTPIAVHKKGKPLIFLNLDLASHDVVSVARGADGRPLFKSNLVGLARTAPVTGAERLGIGTYAFFCSLHTNMKANLRVIK